MTVFCLFYLSPLTHNQSHNMAPITRSMTRSTVATVKDIKADIDTVLGNIRNLYPNLQVSIESLWVLPELAFMQNYYANSSFNKFPLLVELLSKMQLGLCLFEYLENNPSNKLHKTTTWVVFNMYDLYTPAFWQDMIQYKLTLPSSNATNAMKLANTIKTRAIKFMADLRENLYINSMRYNSMRYNPNELYPYELRFAAAINGANLVINA